jgi:hypothetical protein
MATILETDKITILMHEYDTLRDELIQRWVGAQTDISIGVLVLVGVLTVMFTSQVNLARSIILGGIVTLGVIVFIYAMWLVFVDNQRAAARLREIEQEVNSRAGEELLKWETRWGGAATGYWTPWRKNLSGP